MTRRLAHRAAIATFALVLVASACGDDDNSSSSTEPTVEATTTTSSLQALCAARDDLTASVQALTKVDVLKNGTSSLQEAIQDVTTNLTKVKDAASDELKPQVEDFESSLRDLQQAVGNAGSGGVSDIVSAASAAAKSGADLLSALKSVQCEGGS